MTVHTIRTSHPREMLAAIAYQLGFRPADCVVVASLRGTARRLGLIARVDLKDASDAAEALAAHINRDGATAAVVAVYTDDVDLAHDAAALVDNALRDVGVGTVGVWWVTSHDYRPINPQNPGESPSTGQPLDLDTTITAATAVSQGVTLAPARTALAITPATDDARSTAANAYAEQVTRPRDRARDLNDWRAALHATANPAQAGRLAAALADRRMRDAVLCDLIPDGSTTANGLVNDDAEANQHVGTLLGTVLHDKTLRPDPATTEPARALLIHVAAHTDSPAALTLLGFLAWWTGNGAAANIHLDAALDLDPHYRLAQILREGLGQGMGPGWTRP